MPKSFQKVYGLPFLWNYLGLPTRRLYFADSDILRNAHVLDSSIDFDDVLYSMLPNDTASVRSPRLLYFTSDDETTMNPELFHALCDNQGATITMIQSTNGCIFGGYNPVSWESTGKYRASHNNEEFLFSLKSVSGKAPTAPIVVRNTKIRPLALSLSKATITIMLSPAALPHKNVE